MQGRYIRQDHLSIETYNQKVWKTITDIDRHGSQFYNSRSKLQSDFDSFYEEHDIHHVISSLGKPTTLGKIDRWHRTYDVERPRFKRHEQFIIYYNNQSTFVIELHDASTSV
jgi:hypothetical protein